MPSPPHAIFNSTRQVSISPEASTSFPLCCLHTPLHRPLFTSETTPLSQAAKLSDASRIFAIDVNEGKFGPAADLGATDLINPKLFDKPIQQVRDRCR